MRFLGIDYGARKMGFALGDSESRLASPMTIVSVTSDEEALKAVHRLITEYAIDEIVLGIPTNLQGGPSSQEDITRGFLVRLRAEVSCPLHEENESSSSKQAAQLLRQSGLRQDDDAVSAMIVLQSYLDRIR